MNAGLSLVQMWLTDMALLATALLAAALVLRLIVRDAGGRVLLAWGTWLGIAGAAVATLLPGWPRYEWNAVTRLLPGAPVAIPADPESALPIAADWGLPLDSTTEPMPVEQLLPGSTASPQRGSPDIATLAWISAASAGLAWTALGCWQARKLLWHSQLAPPWISGELAKIAAPRKPHTDVRTSGRLTSAVALRAHRPVILLPGTSAEPSNLAAVRAALAHEWAHIRHGDLWLLMLERLLLPLLALHPLFWLLRRYTRLDQELLADAAAAGDKPVEYAEALVAWAKTSSPPPASLAALAFWDRPSNLTRRVHMILHKSRTNVTWLGRVLSCAALACLLALVGSLSVITLQPLAAEDEPAQPAPVVEHPIATLPALPPATPASTTIELSCVAIELEPAELEKALSGGEHPSLPSPAVGLGIQTTEEWRETLGRLEATPGVQVVSRPRLRTMNYQRASVGIALGTVKVEDREEVLGLKVELQPELLPKIGEEQQLLLSIAFERTALDNTPAGSATPPTPMKRKLQTKVAVPLGKVVVVADPSNRSSRTPRPLLLAIEPRLVAEREEARKATPEEVEAVSRREAAAVRHTLLRLQREIAVLLERTARGGVYPPVTSTQGESSAAAASTAERKNPPQFVPMGGDLEKAAAQLQLLMKELKIDGVTIDADPKNGGLILSGPEQQLAELRKLHFENERTSATATDWQLQRKLLELDLREAEIHLKSVELEYAATENLSKKNIGAVSATELQHSRLKVDLAKIQVERTRVRLEAAQAVSPSVNPALPRR